MKITKYMLCVVGSEKVPVRSAKDVYLRLFYRSDDQESYEARDDKEIFFNTYAEAETAINNWNRVAQPYERSDRMGLDIAEVTIEI